MAKMKPCPECGTTHEDHDEGSPLLSVTDPWVVPYKDSYRGRCSVCGWLGPEGLTEEEAIDKWNQRFEG